MTMVDTDWGDQPDYRHPVPSAGSKLSPLALDALGRAYGALAQAKNNPMCNFGKGKGAQPEAPLEPWPAYEQQEAEFVSSTPADDDPAPADPGYETAAAGSLRLGDQVWVDDAWRKVAGLVVDPPPATTQVCWEDQDPDADPHEFGVDEMVFVARG